MAMGFLSLKSENNKTEKKIFWIGTKCWTGHSNYLEQTMLWILVTTSEQTAIGFEASISDIFYMNGSGHYITSTCSESVWFLQAPWMIERSNKDLQTAYTWKISS